VRVPDTFVNLIDRTVQELHQVPGQGTQIYAEDIIAQRVQAMFDLLFDKFWWPDYMEWVQRSLDGVSGRFSLKLEDCKRYEDIRAILTPDSNIPLGELPTDVNPFLLTGGSVLYMEAESISSPDGTYETDYGCVRFWPREATDTDLALHFRKKPNAFTASDVNLIRMDDLMLIYGAAYQHLEMDGTNPNGTQMMQGLFVDRLATIQGRLDGKPVVLDSRRGSVIPNEWFEN
jgi:hypothetical protein